MAKTKVGFQSLHLRAKRMTVSSTPTYFFLLGVLFNLQVCNPKSKPFVETAMPVPISTNSTGVCIPRDRLIKVDAGHSVQWYAADNDYTIRFNPKLDLHPSSPATPPTEITPPPLSIPKQQTASWTAAPNPPDCGDTISGTTGCYFKYNIYRSGTLCNDPGVLVQPQ